MIVIPWHNENIPEAMLQSMVLAHVNQLPGVEVWRMNTGGAYQGKRYIAYGEPGQADLAGLMGPSGRRLEIELKTPKGAVHKTQRAYRERIERLGGLYIVARSLGQAMIPICDALGLEFVNERDQ